MSEISGTSRVLVVIGDPIAHSVSPAMHNAAIRALGLDAVYVPLRVEPVALAHVVRGLEATGTAGNITVPHKVAAAPLFIRLTGMAKDVGAVNTFWSDGGRLVGDNTDVAGLLAIVSGLPAGDTWLVAGTGGSSRAVAVAAKQRQARLLVRSRDSARAASFAAWARDVGADAVPDDGSPASLAVNATPLGLGRRDPPPIPASRLEGCAAALDLVYCVGETAWVRGCRGMGLTVVDGRGVLVAQGALAFERFFPGQQAPRDVMAAAVARALQP